MRLEGNPEMMEEFIANKGERPHKAKAERKPMKRTRIKPESEGMERNRKRWALIKQSMIEAQIKTNGYTSCMECGSMNPNPIDLDHIIPASKNGVWFPSNAQLLCRVCHNDKHQNLPRWTKNEQAFEDKFKDGEPFPDESPGR